MLIDVIRNLVVVGLIICVVLNDVELSVIVFVSLWLLISFVMKVCCIGVLNVDV